MEQTLDCLTTAAHVRSIIVEVVTTFSSSGSLN
jgi:hypothetical protein